MAAYRVKFFEVDDFEIIIDLMELEEAKEKCCFPGCVRTQSVQSDITGDAFWLNSMPYIDFVIINPNVL